MSYETITLLSTEDTLKEAVNKYLKGNTPKLNKNYPKISNLELPKSDKLTIGQLKFLNFDELKDAPNMINTRLGPRDLILYVTYELVARNEDIKVKFKPSSNFSLKLIIEEAMISVKNVKRKSSKISLTFEKEDFQINPFSVVINANRENLLFPKLYDGHWIFTNENIEKPLKQTFKVIDNLYQTPKKTPETKTYEQKFGPHKDQFDFQFDQDHYEPFEETKPSEKSERKYSASEAKYSTTYGALSKHTDYVRKYSSKDKHSESSS